MNDMLRELNQRPISYYPVYRRLAGSTTAGILLSQLMYWFSAAKKDKIFKTDAEIMQETLLSKKELENAKKAIRKLDFIKVTREGLPAKTYYQVNFELLEKAIKNGETSIHETGEQVSTNGGNCIPPKGETTNVLSLTENTTENTTETTEKKENFIKEKSEKSKNFSFTLKTKQPYTKLSKEYRDKLFGYAITVDAASQFQAFVDYHTAKGSAFKDWASAYRTWVRNTTKFGEERHEPIKRFLPTGEAVYVDTSIGFGVREGDKSYTARRIRVKDEYAPPIDTFDNEDRGGGNGGIAKAVEALAQRMRV